MSKVALLCVAAMLFACGGKAPTSAPDSPTTPTTPSTPVAPTIPPDVQVCIPGGTCDAPSPCHVGQYVCSADTKTCVNKDNRDDGTSCGAGNRCSAGECVAPPPTCTPGGTCSPSNPCHQGQNECVGGGLVCQDKNTNLEDGTACGNGFSCKAGACVSPNQCTPPSGSCLPSNHCHDGEYTCDANGALVCSDMNTNLPDGKVCGAGLSCKAGVCVPPLPTVDFFTVSLNHLVGSGTVLMAWGVNDADKVEIDNGIGQVTGANAIPVPVSVTTTWTLKATNRTGVVTQQVTVTVSDPVVARISLASSSSLFFADGVAYPSLTVNFYDSSGVAIVDVPYDLLVNGQVVHGNFTTTTTGLYTFVVRSGQVESNPVNVTAVPRI